MFTLQKHFSLRLPMVPCDQCGNTAQTSFDIDAVITVKRLNEYGYIVDNQQITNESLRRLFASAPLWQGSCEQLAATVADWLAAACGECVESVSVAIENRDIPPPANSRITYMWTPGCDCPKLTPVYDISGATAVCPLVPSVLDYHDYYDIGGMNGVR